jgi:hypothetical protein
MYISNFLSISTGSAIIQIWIWNPALRVRQPLFSHHKGKPLKRKQTDIEPQKLVKFAILHAMASASRGNIATCKQQKLYTMLSILNVVQPTFRESQPTHCYVFCVGQTEFQRALE